MTALPGATARKRKVSRFVQAAPAARPYPLSRINADPANQETDHEQHFERKDLPLQQLPGADLQVRLPGRPLREELRLRFAVPLRQQLRLLESVARLAQAGPAW